MQKYINQPSSLNDKIEETQIMNCFICMEWYTLDSKTPISICQNRHVLCKQCTNNKLFKKQYDQSNNFTGRYKCPKCYQILNQEKFKEDPLLMQICTLIYTIKEKQQSNTQKIRQTYGLLYQQKAQMKFSYQNKISLLQAQKNQILQKINKCQKDLKFQREQNIQAQNQYQKLGEQLQNQKRIYIQFQRYKNEEVQKYKQLLKIKSQENKNLKTLINDQENEHFNLKALIQQKEKENIQLKNEIASLKKKKTQSILITKKTPNTITPTQKPDQIINVKPIFHKQSVKNIVDNKEEQKILKQEKKIQYLLLGNLQKIQGFSIKDQKITKKSKKGFFSKILSKEQQEQDNYISVFSNQKINKTSISCFKIKILATSFSLIWCGIAPQALKNKNNIFKQESYIGYRGVQGTIWVGGKWKEGGEPLKKDDTIKVIVDIPNLTIKFIINDKVQSALQTPIPKIMKDIQFYPVISIKCEGDSVQFLKGSQQF